MAVHDHSIAEHAAWVTRPMLKSSGTTAGYDPYFMAGYARTLHASPSATLFQVVGFLTRGKHPAQVYKATLWAIFASLPWLVALSAAMMGIGGRAALAAVGLFLIYVWTDGGGADYPLAYLLIGMSTYLLSVPLGLVVIAAFVRYLDRGGFGRWIFAVEMAAIGLMVHVTSVLFLIPAGVTAYVVALRRVPRWRIRDHLATWTIPVTALALNAFWWLPALVLRSTSAETVAFFANTESVWVRLGKIVHADSAIPPEPPIQAVLLALGLIGLACGAKRRPLATAALSAFAGSGLIFGYLAGALRSLDFLQPGRQTLAFYVGLAMLGGMGWVEITTSFRRLGSRTTRYAAVFAFLLIGWRLFGPTVVFNVRERAFKEPFLSSDPPPGLIAVLDWVRENVKSGDRLYYEEVGLGQPGDPDPFGEGRYSGLLPERTGVEVVGGFYLHLGLKTNFTQIGEGKLFGGPWERERFLRYARLYRPSAIACWSIQARRFCRENPDLIQIGKDDGRLILGFVRGFEGDTIRGMAEVKAEPGRLRVSGLVPDLDGLVVLRYHSVPGRMRSRPPMRLEDVFLEEDPVPFLGLRPTPGQTEAVLDLDVLPGR